MRDWLKRFTLSIGSNKYMRESAHCGFGGVLLACLLAIVFLFFGIFIGKDVTFGVDYNGATKFKEFLYNAFINEDECALKITVDGGKADVTVDGERMTINTVVNDVDAERYRLNGYELIVDYNDMTKSYDDFSVDCKKSGSDEIIGYDEYVKLTASEKSEYSLRVRYSGKRKTITDEAVVEYETYLQASGAYEEFERLKEKYGSVGDGYTEELYELYVKTYYPDMNSLVGEEVPTLKKYYYDLIDGAGDKYLCIFADMFIGAFVNELGRVDRFGCVYSDGVELNGGARSALDGFIKDLYYANLSTLLFFEILNCLLMLLFTVFIIVAAMLICRLICKFKTIEIGSTFSACVKAVGSCVHVAALAAAVLAAIFGFFRGGTAVTVFALVMFAVIIAVRMTVFYICEYKTQKKSMDETDKRDSGELK